MTGGVGPREQMILVAVVVVVVLIVLAIDALLLMAWLWFRDDVKAGRRSPLFAQQWSLVDAWIGGQIVGVLLIVIVGVLAAVMGVGSGSAPQLSGAYLTAGLVIQNVLFVAVPLAYVIWRYRLTLADIGLSWPPRWRHVRIGLLGGVVVMFVGAACEAGARALAQGIMPAHAFRMLENMTRVTDVSGMVAQLRASPAMAINLFLGVAVLAPIGEEMFFRGFLHNCARRRLGAFWGTLLSATAFALAHGGPLTMPAIIPMGILLAIAYDMTGSLWVSMTMHGVNNGIMVLAILLFPGMAK